ncbi:MAG: response regulator [Proteobacteria bacterium]|nr:response regulator [Pseudomonadota bacterium]
MHSVLIVDDEPAVGEAIRRVLEREGLAVAVVTNPQQALVLLRHSSPELVITDMIMPGMHGVDLILEIRSRYPTVRLIGISGGGTFGAFAYKPGAVSTQAYLTAAREAGADAVLSKPFDLSALVDAVRSVLAEPAMT